MQTDEEIKKAIENIHSKHGASAGLTQEMFNLFCTLQEEYKKRDCTCKSYEGQNMKCPIEHHKVLFCKQVEENCNKKIEEYKKELIEKVEKYNETYLSGYMVKQKIINIIKQ